MRTLLAVGKITPQDGDACLSESFGQRDQQSRTAVGSGAVSQYQAVAVC